jgi:hypothetical protein
MRRGTGARGVGLFCGGMALLGAPMCPAGTAYVSDDLVLGVFAEQNQQGQRLTTLHSGARVETLESAGEYTHVQLDGGISGWVKSSFLVTHEPATVRVKALEEELNRAHATTPALAEAAARSEVLQLKGELAAARSELQAARESVAAAAAPAVAHAAEIPALPIPLYRRIQILQSPWGFGLTAVVALLLGFWWGYGLLARRIKRRFGGLKVY